MFFTAPQVVRYLAKILFFCSLSNAFRQRRLAGYAEEDEADDEEADNRGDAYVLILRDIRDNGENHAAESRSSLAEDIVDAEVLAGLLLGNDLGEIRPGQGLNAALEEADHDTENPEVDEARHEGCQNGNGRIAENADRDNDIRSPLLRHLSRDDSAGEGNKLGD